MTRARPVAVRTTTGVPRSWEPTVLVLVTEWNEFREPDFKKMKQLLKSPVVFDGRNIYSPDQMRGLGFQYFSIGR